MRLGFILCSSHKVSETKAIDLSNVLEVYHGLREVFTKDKALLLSPHRPYNLPSSRLYSLSSSEREAMEKYIWDSLAAGIIQPPGLCCCEETW